MRVAIIGTAPSWVQTPWHDRDLEIWGLNDLYVYGLPRADRWFDLHPLAEMACGGQPGRYLRPQHHLEWLGQLKIPLYLHEAKPEWPHSQTFPAARVWEESLGRLPLVRLDLEGQPVASRPYMTSTPAWMFAFAVLEGAEEIHLYGIHLATEREYVEQRPNFEALIAWALSRGVKVVLPQWSPLFRAPNLYAYEPRPSDELTARQQEAAVVQQRLAVHRAALAQSWWNPWRRRRLRNEVVDLTTQLEQVNHKLLQARFACQLGGGLS